MSCPDPPNPSEGSSLARVANKLLETGHSLFWLNGDWEIVACPKFKPKDSESKDPDKYHQTLFWIFCIDVIAPHVFSYPTVFSGCTSVFSIQFNWLSLETKTLADVLGRDDRLSDKSQWV